MKAFVFLLMCMPAFTVAQDRLHLTFFGGFSNYQGDLQEKRFTMEQSNAALGIGLRYSITPKFSVRGDFKYGRLEATDKMNTDPMLRARNLSFQTSLYELGLLGEYAFFDLEDVRITPIVFAGVAAFRFNPFTNDSLGRRVFLQPLGTEGQGLSQYPDRSPYRLTQIAIPFGAGFRFRITDRAMLGFEMGLRKLFTDYLDDISTTYVDPVALAQARGPKAVEMSYRGGELKDGNPQYPAPGAVRGGAKFKDWYYFSGLTLSVALNTGNRFGSIGKRSNMGCPVVN